MEEQRLRAYSVLDIKAANDTAGKRMFTGTATTPKTDRDGDIVEPMGAQFELPIPLLWQHNSREPIGWVTDAKATATGITITGQVADVMREGRLKDFLADCWDMMTAKLVRGLSIGFRGIESNRIENTYSMRYVKWAWYELSAVTIPANVDCSISAIKSFDMAALRLKAPTALPIVRLDSAPAVTGKATPGASGPADQTRRKGVVYLK
jgi:HK97 family phage prohead protease